VYFLRRRRFTNDMEARIRDVIVVLPEHFPGAADANDEETQKKKTGSEPSWTCTRHLTMTDFECCCYKQPFVPWVQESLHSKDMVIMKWKSHLEYTT
jgi:hypothetical protein